MKDAKILAKQLNTDDLAINELRRIILGFDDLTLEQQRSEVNDYETYLEGEAEEDRWFVENEFPSDRHFERADYWGPGEEERERELWAVEDELKSMADGRN